MIFKNFFPQEKTIDSITIATNMFNHKNYAPWSLELLNGDRGLCILLDGIDHGHPFAQQFIQLHLFLYLPVGHR